MMEMMIGSGSVDDSGWHARVWASNM
jgi:hypothetical protein